MVLNNKLVTFILVFTSLMSSCLMANSPEAKKRSTTQPYVADDFKDMYKKIKLLVLTYFMPNFLYNTIDIWLRSNLNLICIIGINLRHNPS